MSRWAGDLIEGKEGPVFGSGPGVVFQPQELEL